MTEATMALDARQRAMLEEMGVKVWWPTAERTALVAPRERVSVAPTALDAPATPEVTERVVPTPARRTPGAAHAAAILIEPAIRRLYDGGGPPEDGWLLVVDTPPSADGSHGDEPFAGEPGRLLQNMLRALQLDRGTAPVHLACVHRSTTGAPRGDGSALGTGFAAQAVRLAPRLVLALGPLSAQSLLRTGEPLGKLRGRVAHARFGEDSAPVPLVASYHPIYLLRNPADKAKAWTDLCLAAAEFERSEVPAPALAPSTPPAS
jgi:uracil-DNA glycosylase family 4